ncbi:MAG: ABC transporter ATP-binding protein [Clostridia bacterium]|nr:ABC transporter ATP-binding protein [Clostridia bacterium]
MAERLLDVRDLCVEFDTRQGVVHAVRHVGFHVDAGEILGFVGESGSGKSVSVMSCLGLIARNGRVVSGSIRFDGRELSGAGLTGRRQRRAHEQLLNGIRGNEISMIFQDPMTYMNPVLTVGTQLTEGIRAHTHCSKQAAWMRGVELLTQVGISSPERRMKQYPYEFSGGMRQRMIIAIALACEPKLLIADEPTTALDVTVQAQILELIRKRARETGTSVIMITHDLGVVAALCDRISILYGGRVAETGTTDEIFYQPKHPYTQGLLNSIARRQRQPDGSYERTELASIPGTPPDLLKINAGCPFASRCDCAMKICRDYSPATTRFSDTHTADCWLHCREQAARIVAETDRLRGERLG